MGVFAMPSLGADMEAGKLAEWLVKPGDTVKRGDIVAVVETQKGAIEIEVFEEGTVHALKAEVGQELPVGAPLAVVLGEGEAPPAETEAPKRETAPPPTPEPEEKEPEPVAAPAPPPKPAPAAPSAVAPGAVAASPAARVRAHELSVDLATVKGTGPGGVIVLQDVEQGSAPAQPAQRAVPAKKAVGSPIEEMRKAIAAAMTRSKQTIPHVYLTQTMDIQDATDWLAARNADRPPTERLLLGALFVRAATIAASRVKVLNGHYTDDALHSSEEVNPGVAVALRGGGLVAPAMMDAAKMSLEQTMAGMRDLVTRARAGRLRSSEMTKGTLTVSMLGETGAEAMSGVIFPPQVALVGLGAPQTRPWVVDNSVVPRTVVTVTVSADHRVADGRVIAKYLAEFEDLVSDPEAL